MSCATKKVSADILIDCDNLGKKGISNGTAVLINFEDIDRAASTVNGETITDLVLKAGATGYKVEWYKDLANSGGTFVPSTEAVDGFTNDFVARLSGSTAENAARANEIKDGHFVMVYETKFKGADGKDAFKVAGWEQGMKLSEMTNRTNENSGATLYTLATEEGEVEQYPYRIFLEGDDEAVTRATFESLFASV